MVLYSSKYRSKESEIMDNFDLHGDEMKLLLTDLKNINKWLGGNSITRNGIRTLLKGYSKEKEYVIVDIGCGDGEMLRQCALFGKREGFKFQLVGIDANPFILEEAKERSKDFPNITFQKNNVFSEEIELPKIDIALCTLFLHHFPNQQITGLLNKLIEKTKVGIVVNDLHRSRLAFILFRIVGKLFIKTKIARHDGLVSIARGFKKIELEQLSEAINPEKTIITWKWAFRYQWILSKNI
ncbi:hypothetical protein ATE92_2366 [Ulvibacter sp. MAR_2010_11]|uniref:methyltransferase domain-containing protein n=1 Tax=Ulvibacter sp. MAR_2010_11 TaxID=1250229 RepID=UPI000C2C91FD|nr:methyltransferase domain-containing protein [Ulvibacter sp. MAR_2010_11]PKA84195.1 hypothetical protein ATE92_2366 [Ulvibacter sp. MAR_2010_11]